MTLLRITCCASLGWVLGLAASASLGDEPSVKLVEAPLTAEDREHWAFRPLASDVQTPDAPRELVRNEIDGWIWAGLRQRGLSLLPAAGRLTLLRRLSFDLHGVPPSPEDCQQFLQDSAPDAYERLVDRLLASPRYGERWAQHWLDVARYAETDGFEFDHPRPDAWRYRDWVIAALNADMPYDEFIRWQLAGDEVVPADQNTPVPTMFCLAGPDMPDVNSQEERRHNVLNELTATVGSAVLGLQLGCAQCHDHKYDPLSLGDFYRFRAWFEPSVQVVKNQSLSTLKAVASAAPPSHVYWRGDWRQPGPRVEPGLPRVVAAMLEPGAGDKQVSSNRRTELVAGLFDPRNALPARVIVNRLWQYHFGEGLVRTASDFGIVGDSPSHPQLLDWLAGEMSRRGWSWKTLQRLIVTSATYRQASRPDDSEWSAELRTRAQANWRAALEHDPGNLYLGRFPRQRLTGEAIRDAMLVAAGQIHWEQGGPGVRPPLPPEIVKTLLKNQWNETPEASSHARRSIYVFARRNLRYPIFEVYDRPDGNASCPRRSRSTTAPQSLLLLNSQLSLQSARALAGRAAREADGQVEGTIHRAVWLSLGRPPTSDEQRLLRQFWESQTATLQREGRPAPQLALPHPTPSGWELYRSAALTDLCLALYNTNEFIYVD